jgi:hypothetical protein
MPTLTFSIKRQSIKLAAAFLGLAVLAQDPLEPGQTPAPDEPRRLPNGTLQADAIRKADQEANLRDLERIRQLSAGITEMLEKTKGNVLSMRALRDMEEIEKLARRVRGRMRRY